MWAKSEKSSELQRVLRPCDLEIPRYQEYLKQNLLPFPADWPGWYYPKKLIANNRSDKYTSLIPEQGQFHVALNAAEDTVIIFKYFFDKLFLHLFGSVLQKKPRVTAALLGWLMVRDKVLKKINFLCARVMSLFLHCTCLKMQYHWFTSNIKYLGQGTLNSICLWCHKWLSFSTPGTEDIITNQLYLS